MEKLKDFFTNNKKPILIASGLIVLVLIIKRVRNGSKSTRLARLK